MHEEVLTDDQRGALAVLAQRGLLSRFYLVGGTAAALHMGHRLSIDFDLFCNEPFDRAKIAEQLTATLPLTITFNRGTTIQGQLNRVRFAFVQYPYPLIRQTLDGPMGLRVIDVEDLAPMKLVAISQRGSRKDFIDLYFLIRGLISLEKIFELLPEKFVGVRFEPFHLVRALQYFEDAEKQDMPTMLVPFEWDECKAYFRRVVPAIARKLLGRP